jgi:Xaa-Pro aminopeptidase
MAVNWGSLAAVRGLTTWPLYGRFASGSSEANGGILTAESQRLAAELRAIGADAAVLARPEDVCYATGFEVPPAIDAGAAFAYGPTLAVVSRDGASVLLSPAAYVARSEEMSLADETVLVDGFGHFEPVDGRANFVGTLVAALRAVDTRPNGTIALDPSWTPVEVQDALGDRTVVDLRPAVRRARLLKTEREIELLRNAAAVCDAGHEGLLELAAPERNELDVMGDVLTRVDRAAGQPVPWAGELVSGPRTGRLRYPGGPLDRTMERGDTVLMDLSVRVRGYWSDCTNSFALDAEPTSDQLRFFRAARNAFEAAVEQLRPGRVASDAHAAASAAFAAAGFQPAHYTGHQIGVTVNEEPRLVEYDQTPIEAGMVFSVEPGAYGGELGTGSRCERVVLVRDDGPEILSGFPWGMHA